MTRYQSLLQTATTPEAQRAREYLAQRGFAAATLAAFRAGCAPLSRPHRLAGRITIPVHDQYGRLVDIAGRAYVPGVEPKWWHGRFPKRYLLFNLHRAKHEALRHRTIIITEGIFDVMALWQLGFRYVTACLGTGMTPWHAQLILRYATRCLLLFDGDEAGRAAIRGAAEVLGGMVEVRSADLPDGEDPASLLVKDPSLLQNIIAKAMEG